MDKYDLDDLEDAMRGFPNDINPHIDRLAATLRQTLLEDDKYQKDILKLELE